MLDLKIQDASRQEIADEENAEVDRLREKLKRYQKEEETLSRKLATIDSEKQDILAEIQTLNKRNTTMKSTIEELESQKRIQIKENNRLKEDNVRLSRMVSKVPGDLASEKRNLEKEVARLERKLSDLEKSVEKAASIIEKKRELMNSIMQTDSRNQSLHKEIDDLMQQIAQIKSEMSDLEAQLPAE